MSTATMLDVLANALALLGLFFYTAAMLGFSRFPNVYWRLHASTKSATLGSGLVCLSVILVSIQKGEWMAIGIAICIQTFLSITAPVSSQMIARSAYWCGVPLNDPNSVDELAPARDRHPRYRVPETDR